MYINKEITHFQLNDSEVLKLSTISQRRLVSTFGLADYALGFKKVYCSGADVLTKSDNSWPENPDHLKDLIDIESVFLKRWM